MTYKFPLYSKLYYRFIGVKNSIRAFFARLKYRWNGGYRCDECETLIPIHYHHIESEVISNSSGHLYCSYCLGAKIAAYFRYSEQLSPLETKKCDWMHRPAKTIGIIWGNDPIAKQLGLNVRFGGRWWNGHNACREVFSQALIHTEASYKTSVWVYDKKSGKMQMIDRNGVKADGNGSW
jgi:hypothetical protein